MIQERNFQPSRNDTPRAAQIKASIRDSVITEVATRGVVPQDVDWKSLRQVYLVLMKDASLYMNEKYPDIQRTIQSSFEDSLKDLVDLLLSFDRPLSHQPLYSPAAV